jgi:hypothetical protein
MEADRFRLMGEVVRVDADAVVADQAWAEWLEILLGPGCLQHLAGLETELLLEQHGKLVISAMLTSRWMFSITLAPRCSGSTTPCTYRADHLLQTEVISAVAGGAEPEVTLTMSGRRCA